MKALFLMTFQRQENRRNRWAKTQISMQEPDKCKQIKNRTRKRKLLYHRFNIRN